MINFTHLSEAFRIFKRSLKVRNSGFLQYEGNAKQICKKAVDNCWNKRYFQVSSGHFCEFYIRDFGWCVDSLLKLGYKKKVLKTLNYVLSIYSKQGLKTTITPKNKAVDIFEYSPDSLMYLLRSLRVAKAFNLVKKYRFFLEKEVDKYFDIVIDKETGLVTTKRTFSSMKDQSLRKSSCYDNCCTAKISKDLDILKLKNPFKQWDYEKLIIEYFWNGNFFEDDITKPKFISGDANIIPYFLEIITDKKMLLKSIKAIQKAKLDKPFPLKYTQTSPKLNFVSKFVSGYEHQAIWMHMGYIYLKLLKRVNKKDYNKNFNIYTKLIEKHKNFLEVFDRKGKPFKSPFYYSDESMLWSANYLK